MSYLHLNTITHRDLKPANILIYDNMRIKISDFGLAKLTDVSKATMTFCGTMMFCAPEILGTVRGAKPLPFKTDIYSLGLTACFMMIQRVPGMDEIYLKKIEFPEEYSKELVEFIYFCLVR